MHTISILRVKFFNKLLKTLVTEFTSSNTVDSLDHPLCYISEIFMKP